MKKNNWFMEIKFDDIFNTPDLYGLKGGKVGDVYGLEITKIRHKNKKPTITLNFKKLKK